MSQREFAKSRGVSHVAVQRAIKRGRLVQSVRDGRIIDPELADREWAANTDLSRAPGYVRDRAAGRDVDSDGEDDAPSSGGPPASMSEASLAEKHWKAKLAELKFKEAAKELVPARDVESRLTDVFMTCRTKLLAIPSRARHALPHLTVADITALESLIREALEELASE